MDAAPDALAQARDGLIDLIFPTYRSVQALAQYETSAELLAAVDAVWRDHDEPMRVADRGQGWMLALDVDDDAALERDALDHAAFTVARPGSRIRSQAGVAPVAPSGRG